VKNASGQYNYLVNGQMTTGWQKDGALWYYMDENGVMKTGWVQVNGTWYWLGYHGDMKTGWQSINDKWYYFTESGAMLENTTVTLGGVPCTFDASGAWVTG
jgi:glucan-binding YG repeat protein